MLRLLQIIRSFCKHMLNGQKYAPDQRYFSRRQQLPCKCWEKQTSPSFKENWDLHSQFFFKLYWSKQVVKTSGFSLASIPNGKQQLYPLDYRSIFETRADLSHQMGTRGKYFASSSAVLRNEIIYVRCQNGPLSYIQFFSGYYAHCFEMNKVVQIVIYILGGGNDFLSNRPVNLQPRFLF